MHRAGNPLIARIIDSEESKMAWQPDEHGLKQILDLLKESQSPDNAIQRAVQQVSSLPCNSDVINRFIVKLRSYQAI